MAAHGKGYHARCGEQEAADDRLQAGGADAERCSNSTLDGNNRKRTGVPLDRRTVQQMRYRGGGQRKELAAAGARRPFLRLAELQVWDPHSRKATKVAADDADRREDTEAIYRVAADDAAQVQWLP